MLSRTTKWRRKKHLQANMRCMVTKEQSISSADSKSLDEVIGSIHRAEDRQDLTDDAMSPAASTLSSSPVSSHTLSIQIIVQNTDDESLWFDVRDDDVDVWIDDDVPFGLHITDENENQCADASVEAIVPTKKQIATAMIIVKSRHGLSMKSIDHLCKMMRIMNVPNCPPSFESINQVLTNEYSSFLSSNTFYICPICYSASYSPDHCESMKCKSSSMYSRTTFACMIIPILSQLRDILARTSDLNIEHQKKRQGSRPNDKMRDIYDGQVYQQICIQENGYFLSLTMNVDGIQISESSSTSLWVVTFAINEIKRTERFKMKNVIIGGILSSNVKPSQKHMEVFLQPIVKELQELEKGQLFEVKNSTLNELTFFKVFLICCCADKPAQSLIQGISEPTGAYGCGRCELQGITVALKEKSQKKIRVFPLVASDQTQPRLRTNETYDEFMKIDPSERAKKRLELRDQMRGHVGVCLLRSLTYFDVGSSFVSDSLHNIYHGVMRRLLNLWFEQTYRKKPWSLASKMHRIDRYLSSIKYPSTSTRVPRSIMKYSLFKGNELRAICLYGFPAFCRALPTKYARHFLLLVIAVHLSESRSLDRDQVDDIATLCDAFLRQFPDLYTARNNTQAVHSLQHIASSVRDFGCLGNYSTFNFENILGLITSTVHSTRRHAQEIQKNLNLLRLACIELEHPSFHPDLKRFAQTVQSSKRVVLPSFVKSTMQVKFRYEDKNAKDLMTIQAVLRQHNVKLYRSCYISTMRLTTNAYQANGQQIDSCVLFILAGKPAIGFITNIIETDQQQLLFRVHEVSIDNKLYVRINSKRITCPNVFHGNLDTGSGLVYIKPQAIVEKLVYVYDDHLRCYIFFRIPNLCESS